MWKQENQYKTVTVHSAGTERRLEGQDGRQLHATFSMWSPIEKTESMEWGASGS